MKDEIVINLRALNQEQRDNIYGVIDQACNDVDDETNEEALEILMDFTE
jgi:hypothetical protein